MDLLSNVDLMVKLRSSILCGWPGGLVAMKIFSNKTKKQVLKL